MAACTCMRSLTLLYAILLVGIRTTESQDAQDIYSDESDVELDGSLPIDYIHVAEPLQSHQDVDPVPQTNFNLFGEVLPQEYPPPEEKEPEHFQWLNPVLYNQGRESSVVKRSTDQDSDSHSRVKRSVYGTVSEIFQFSLEASPPYENDYSTFKFGSVIDYTCTITASTVDQDLKLEIYTELNGGAYFMISNVRFGHVGSNLDTFYPEDVEILYYSVYGDGRYDQAVVDLGTLHNSLVDLSSDRFSQLELLFEVQTLRHDGWTNGTSYGVRVGVQQNSTLISVAHDTNVFDSDVEILETRAYDKFSVSGPDVLSVGMTGRWTVTASIHELASDISMDVLTYLDLPAVLSIDRIDIISIGENFRHGINKDTFNFTSTSSQIHGDHARIDLGAIINAGYHNMDYDTANNTITFAVDITMMEHEFEENSSYPIDFLMWHSEDSGYIELLWSDQQSVQAIGDEHPEMIISADFMTWPSADMVSTEGFFGIVVNMSIPGDTIAGYMVEVNVPVQEGESVMNIERVRVSKIGYNFPHLQHITDYHVSNISRDGEHVDYLALDFGPLQNTGQRDELDEDHIVQVEIGIRLLENVTIYYSLNELMPIDIGVTHNEKIYWVDVVNINITDVPLSYDLDNAPKFSLTNVMGRDFNISSETAGVVDLDLIIPPGASYDSIYIEFNSANKSEEETTLKIIGVEVAHIGKALLLQRNEAMFSGNGETEVDNEPVYHFANQTLIYVTSLSREDSPRYDFEDRTLRVRVFIVCRGRTSHLLNDGDTLWLSATATVSEDYIYAGRVGMTYSETSADYYTSFDWKPDFDMQMSEGYYTNTVRRGAVLRYNIAVNVPYRTTADIDVRIESMTSPVQVCQVLRKGFGDGVVDYLPPNTTDAEISYDSLNQRHFESFLNIPALTSFGYGTYTDHVVDAYVNFTAIIMLEELAVVNETYDFLTEITLGHLDTVRYQPKIVATDALPSLDVRPQFKLIHHMGTDTINVGGSEIIYFDMYIPPATSHRYHVVFHAPWNDTSLGEYKIHNAFMVSAGSDLACFNGFTTNVTIPFSEGDRNTAVFTTSYIANVAPHEGGERFKLQESNKVRLAVHVALIMNTTIPEGEHIPISVLVDMNNGADIFLDYLDLKVISPDDDRNAILPSNLTLDITAHGDRVFSIGERQFFHGLVRVPPGMAVTQFRIIVESPMVGDETLLTVAQPNITRYGNNMLETEDFEHSHNETDFLQTYSRMMHFGFLRNLGIVNQSTFIDETPGEDELEFEFSIRLMDHVTLAHDYSFPFNVLILYGSENDTVVNSTGDTTITVYAPESDTTHLYWNVYITDPVNMTEYDSIVSFGMDIGVTHMSRRFPDNVTVFYRVPFISEVIPDSMTFIGMEHEFQATAEINQFGLQFQFNRMRFDYQAHINFSIVVDPDAYMEYGLLERHVDVPVDIRYYEETKTTPGSFKELFTEVRVLEFEVYIPECLDSLGVANGDILNCQITASTDDGTHTAQNGRLNNGVGWATLDKGPPLYQNEYIQVDMGGKVRISAVSIQPLNGAVNNRITSFKLQYSWEGIRWEYLRHLEADVIYDVSWVEPITPTSTVTVELKELAFLTRYIRILPQSNANGSYVHGMRFDIHGCPWPYKSVLPSYVCAAPPDPTKNYVERQMLAVNESIFICMLSQANDLPYCSGSNDLGLNWFALDNNVMNMLGYEPSGDAVYALARNKLNTLRSTDKGHSWVTVEESDFDAMSALEGYMEAVALPFPLDSSSVADLLDTYGVETEASVTWSVSRQALHAYPGTKAEIVGASKTTEDDQVGYWGSIKWH